MGYLLGDSGLGDVRVGEVCESVLGCCLGLRGLRWLLDNDVDKGWSGERSSRVVIDRGSQEKRHGPHARGTGDIMSAGARWVKLAKDRELRISPSVSADELIFDSVAIAAAFCAVAKDPSPSRGLALQHPSKLAQCRLQARAKPASRWRAKIQQ